MNFHVALSLLRVGDLNRSNSPQMAQKAADTNQNRPDLEDKRPKEDAAQRSYLRKFASSVDKQERRLRWTRTKK